MSTEEHDQESQQQQTETSSSTKPINSSYYHGRTTTKGEEAERYKPQLIDPTTPTETSQSPSTTTTAGSKWNSAQTFETREFSNNQITLVLNDTYNNYAFTHKSTDLPTLTLSSVQSIDGYASRTFTRGKQVLTFELTVKFNVNHDDNQIENGHIEFQEVDFASTDDFPIKYVGLDSSYVKVFKTHEDKLRSKFNAFIKNILALPEDHE